MSFITKEYAWHSEDERDLGFAGLLADDLTRFCLDSELSGLLVLIKEEFSDPQEPEPHFLHSYKLGSVKMPYLTGGLGFMGNRPMGARISQEYAASYAGSGYGGAVSVTICTGCGAEPGDAQKACQYALEQYKARILEVFPEWSTDYLSEPVLETDVEWPER